MIEVTGLGAVEDNSSDGCIVDYSQVLKPSYIAEETNTTLTNYHGAGSWTGSESTGDSGSGNSGKQQVYIQGSKSPWTYELRDKVIKLLESIKKLNTNIRKESKKEFEENKRLLNDNLIFLHNIEKELQKIRSEVSQISNNQQLSNKDIIKKVKGIEKKIVMLDTSLRNLDTKEDLRLIQNELEDIVSMVCKTLSDEELEELANELERNFTNRNKREKK